MKQPEPRRIAQIRAERVLVVAREAMHDLLQVQAQVVARLVNRQMLRPGHVRLPAPASEPENIVGLTPPRLPQMTKGTNNPIIKCSPAAAYRTRIEGVVLGKVVDGA